MAQKNLYALLIGINDYQNEIRKLYGCVNDVKRVEAYLEESVTDRAVHIKTLFDAEATKDQIVNQFRTHLGQAKAGDTVLLHYSGHGCQEAADPVWTSEFDDKLECLVCYNETGKPFLLADKELRFLINELHQKQLEVHILTLFDCCHSGDNTRGEIMIEAQAIERRYARVFKARDWSEFIFSDSLSKEKVDQSKISEVLPEAPHTSISACQSNESAWEIAGSGIFTKNLLEVLRRSEGKVTYYDLKKRIKFYVKSRKPQTPQLYVQGNAQKDFFRCFLGSDCESNPMYGRVFLQAGQLVLDMGLVHGVSSFAEKAEIILADDSRIPATIKSIEKTQTILDIGSAQMQALEGVEFKGYVDGFMSAPLSIYLKDEEGDPKIIEEIKSGLKSSKYISIVDEPTQNDYTVVIKNGKFNITSDYDYYRPLIEPVPYDRVYSLVADLKHLSKWKYAKYFKNENPTFFKEHSFIDVIIHQQMEDGTWEIVSQHENQVVLKTRAENGNWKGKIKIELKNTSERDLYCSLLYLQANFGSTPLLDNPVMLIEAQKSIFAFEGYGREIPIQLEDYTLDYNWEAELHDLKVFVSTKGDLDISNFIMKALPMPPTLASESGIYATRGILFPKKATDDWTTVNIGMCLPNPMYNKVTENKLNQLLEHPVLSEYALTMYYEADFMKGIKLKDEIEVIPDKETEKGDIFFDGFLNIANRIAKNNRRNQFKRNFEKFPERILMISEGDSWFQHPLVLDIIDHLMPHYNIYGIGGAGDELQNYITSEEYLEAIDQVVAEYASTSNPLRYLLLR